MSRGYVVRFCSYCSLFPRAPCSENLPTLRCACPGLLHGSPRRGRVKRSRSAFILLVLLVFCFSLTVPAEDLPETGYDESEAFPYESTPLFSNVISQAAVSTTGVVRSVVRLRSRTPSRLAVTRITDRDSHQFAKAQVARALLCTLLC
jgi:hypothetical protein